MNFFRAISEVAVSRERTRTAIEGDASEFRCGRVMTNNDLSLAFENCVIASAWKTPDSQILDTPEIYKLTNKAAPYEFMNGIYRTRLNSENADKEIDTHFQFYRDNKISFRWYAFPHSQPADLVRRIEELHPKGVTEMQCLYARTDDPAFAIPNGVAVEELSSGNLEDYIEANIAGWNPSGEQAERIRREIRTDFEKGDMGYRAFLARCDGTPASTGLMRIVPNAGYFYGGSTRPEFRRKGAYRGLVAYRLRLLCAQEIPMAFVLAIKATSAPICRKLGFNLACECRSYDFSF